MDPLIGLVVVLVALLLWREWRAWRFRVRTRPPRGRTHLYRLYDRRGKLLYIGISHDAAKRVANHRQFKPWGKDIHQVFVTQYRSRRKALIAEMRAIQSERPRYNIIHNGKETP